MSDMTQLIIYQKHYDLMVYSFPIIGRFPKEQRFVLGQGFIGLDDVKPVIMSWLGHAKHADSWRLRKRIFDNLMFVRDATCIKGG